MTDISTTSWSEVDANNNQTSPEGWPSVTMLPNQVEPSARMNMGGVKRFWNRINPVYAATQSTADSYVVSPTQALSGYNLYEKWNVRMGIANASTSPTLTIGSLPPQPIKKYTSAGLTVLRANDIQAKDHSLYWDGTQFVLQDPDSPAELGTWTPTLTFATAGDLNVAYSTRTGAYLRNGQFVMLSFDIVTSTFTFTTASGTMQLTGLPFTQLNTTGFNSRNVISWGGITKANYTQISASWAINTTQLTFGASGSGQAISNVSAADTPSAGTMTLRGTVFGYIA